MDVKEKLLKVDLCDYNLSERELLLGAAVKFYLVSKEEPLKILKGVFSDILHMRRAKETKWMLHRATVNGEALAELINIASQYCSSEILGQIKSAEEINDTETSLNDSQSDNKAIFSLEISKLETNEFLSALDISPSFILFLATCATVDYDTDDWR